MRIGIDLDGCVYDFVDSLRRYLVRYEGFDPATLPRELSWDFFSDQWGMTFADFRRYCDAGVNAGVVFRAGNPINDFRGNALSALYALKRAGHSLHIVTDRSYGRRSHTNTAVWLGVHEIPFDSLTFSADKTAVPVDVFVDDRPKNVGALRAAGVEAWVLDNAREDQAGHPFLIADWSAFVDKVASR